MAKTKNTSLKTIILLAAILLVSGLALTGLNVLTAPIIEKNASSAANDRLLAVMPQGQGFEKLDLAGLADIPETVQEIYQETSGLGYVLCLSTTKGYTHEPLEFTLGIDAEGKICGTDITAYPETKDIGDYPQSFIGKDSALADVGLVGGVTFSSTAFKDAVSDGFHALIANELVGAGVKGDDQILLELLPDLFPGIANQAGVAQTEEIEGVSGSIQKAVKALNGSGVACIVADGENTYLGIANLAGSSRFFNTAGEEVPVSEALAGEVTACAAANLTSTAEADSKKLQKLAGEGAELTELKLDGVLNCVTSAFQITGGEGTLYGFAARPYGYSNIVMTVYYVLDENGAIVSMTADEFILIKEYFSDYTLDEPAYKQGFVGVTGDSWTGEQALISGATVSSEAVATATGDVFAAFQALVQNGGDAQ